MTRIQDIRWGIEIETVGLDKEKIARAIQSVVGGYVEERRFNTGHGWACVEPGGKVWRVKRDASCENTALGRCAHGEIVSPIMTYDRLAELQEIVRAVRKAGAKVDRSCGIHIHVDGAIFDVKSLWRLCRFYRINEELLIEALDIRSRVENGVYCQKMDSRFYQQIRRHCPSNMTRLNRAWYGSLNRDPWHYDGTRRRALNLHSIFYHGTVEWRWFQSTLHAGEVKTFIQLSLAMAARAVQGKRISSRALPFTKSGIQTLCYSLGMIGMEFQTARHHLRKNLPATVPPVYRQEAVGGSAR